MKLTTQLNRMAFAVAALVLVVVGALLTVGAEVFNAQEAMDIALTDLETHLELNQNINHLAKAKYREVFEGVRDNDVDKLRANVQSSYEEFRRRVEREFHEAGEVEELRDIDKSRQIFDVMSKAGDEAVALQRTGKDFHVQIDEAFRQEEQLLPLLRQALERERDEMRESIEHAGRVAALARWVGGIAALLGLLVLTWVLRGVTRQIGTELGLLLAGISRFATTGKAAGIAPLTLVELNTVSDALNQMSTEVQTAQESKVRIERLAAVGQLAASIGHELRNPLSAARNAIHFVEKSLEKEQGLSPRIRQFLGLADRELGVCNRTIADLLDFARERKLELVHCSVRSLVAEVIEVVQAPEGALLENLVPEELPAVEVDRDQFRQVVSNLVQNAIEAVAGRTERRVTVSAAVEGDQLVVKIQDTGQGISEESLRSIFEPLFTTKTRGTGLGLAIVRKVVERHQGQVTVESHVDEGTTFFVGLPLIQVKS